MNKLEELRNRLSQAVTQMRALIDKASAEGRDNTAEEMTEYGSLEASVDKINKDIEREERLQALESKNAEVVNPPHKPNIGIIVDRSKEPIENLAHMVYLMRFEPDDRRLREVREQSMGIGEKGGFMVPTQWSGDLLSIPAQAAAIRPRATVIPAGTPPDSSITMPALDQTAAQNMYGGVTVSWTAEGGAKAETDMNLKEVTLTPQEVAGHIVVTDKLLRNWSAADAVLRQQLSAALVAAQENAFLSGNGASKPVGILDAACTATISYARAGAGAIAFADVRGMLARLKFGGSPVWVASQTILPQLMAMVDAGNNSVWLPSGNIIGSIAGTLFGIPLFLHDRSPALGTKGDLVLADFGYYLIKDGSGPYIDASPHVYFTNNKTVIKIFTNVDGHPWLTAPIPLEGSAANTVSPFVVLT